MRTHSMGYTHNIIYIPTLLKTTPYPTYDKKIQQPNWIEY